MHDYQQHCSIQKCCIVVDSETNRLNFAITANCIVVGNEINRLNFATFLNETGKLTAQVKFQEPGPAANISESYRCCPISKDLINIST